MTPEWKFVQTHGLAVARTLEDISCSTVYARIVNPDDTGVTINKGTPMALPSPVEEVGPSFELEELKENNLQKRRAKSGPEIPEQRKSMFEQACAHLRSEQRINFKTFNFQHEENFAKPGEVGRTKFETHKIKLKDENSNQRSTQANSFIQKRCT